MWVGGWAGGGVDGWVGGWVVHYKIVTANDHIFHVDIHEDKKNSKKRLQKHASLFFSLLPSLEYELGWNH